MSIILTQQIAVCDSHPTTSTAMKSAVTDAMKRAARHFGERLGNALYKCNGIRNAPRTNKEALARLEREDALNLFGDQAKLRAEHEQRQGCSQDRTSPTCVTTDVIGSNSVNNQPGPCSGSNVVSRPSSSGSCGGMSGPSRHSFPPSVMPSPMGSANQNVYSRSAMPGALNQQSFAPNQTSNRNYYNQHARNNNNNGILPQQQQQQQQQTSPANIAMPPPGPYNSSRQYTTAARNVHQYGSNNNSIIPDHKRGADSSTGQRQNGSDANKRQRMNPYAGNTSRLSV